MNRRRSQQAVALVITLIMLAVITVVAVAFLALAMRDRSAASTADKLTRAQVMAGAAQARPIAEIGAQILEGRTNGGTSLMGFDLLVSHTNDTGDFGAPVFVDPATLAVNRPLVEADTNRTFLDLNRNGVYDPPTNGLPGDPQWLAVRDQAGPLSDKNHYIGRICYFVLPSGKSLDLGVIHNQAKPAIIEAQTQSLTPNPNSEGYIREFGLGSWELNLASFLVDLNTNAWHSPFDQVYGSDYVYYDDPTTPNMGAAFADAFDLLRYRYASNFTTLSNASPVLAEVGEQGTNNWAGSDSPRHYFDFDALFDAQRPYSNFVKALKWVQTPAPDGAGTNDYNRQTFYRLLSQMSMDSVPETPKINLDFINVDPDTLTPTNLVENGYYDSWTNDPSLFFRAVARRLFAAYNLPGVIVTPTNFAIPIAPTNYYTPAVQRVLQLTANLYDATQDGPVSGLSESLYFPTVFRPLFEDTGSDRDHHQLF